MGYRSVEATRRRAMKRIERLEEKQKALIDRLVYSLVLDKKRKLLKWRISRLSKKIETERNVIRFEKRAKHD